MTLFVYADSFSFSHNRQRRVTKNNDERPILFRQTGLRNSAEGVSSHNNNEIEKPGKNRLLVFGLGNIGTLLAQRSTSIDQDDRTPFFDSVFGTTRGGAKDIDGIRAINFESYQELEDIIPSCTHILITIPPVDHSSGLDKNDNATFGGGRPKFCDPVLNQSNLSIQNLIPANTWIGYVSSTSVYGNHDGEWVNEDSEVKCKPGTKGELYYRAENEWRKAAQTYSWKLHIFRSSGLYGDERSAIHTIRKRGAGLDPVDKVAKSNQGKSNKSFPTSRIHEEDVSRAILSAMVCEGLESCGNCLWNLADDDPAPRTEVMEFGTQLLVESNLLPPKKVDSNQSSRIPQQSERARRRLTDRKRVGNHRLKDLLLPDGKLIYPTYREGLQSVLDCNRKEWTSDAASE